MCFFQVFVLIFSQPILMHTALLDLTIAGLPCDILPVVDTFLEWAPFPDRTAAVRAAEPAEIKYRAS